MILPKFVVEISYVIFTGQRVSRLGSIQLRKSLIYTFPKERLTHP